MRISRADLAVLLFLTLAVGAGIGDLSGEHAIERLQRELESTKRELAAATQIQVETSPDGKAWRTVPAVPGGCSGATAAPKPKQQQTAPLRDPLDELRRELLIARRRDRIATIAEACR